MTRNPKTQATPIRFHHTEFASGQEPDIDGAYRNEDFATLMETSFELGATDVARMIGKQRRALKAAMENMTETQAFYALANSSVGDRVKRAFVKEATQLLEDDIDASSDDPGLFRAIDVKVEWNTENQYEFWDADVNPNTLGIRFTAEFDVIGRWETRD